MKPPKALDVFRYRTAGLADKITRYLPWRGSTSGGATSNTVHWTVSAGKEHLFVSIEGPRQGEPGYNISSTPCRGSLFLGDIVPYFGADTVAAVVCVSHAAGLGSSDVTVGCNVSRNAANNASWVTGKLLTLAVPILYSSTLAVGSVQRIASGDGKTYLWPYVVVEDTAGLRGRIGKAFYAGMGYDGSASGVDPIPSPYSRVTYSGETYMVLMANALAGVSGYTFNAFGGDANGGSGSGPIVAVPYA